MNEAIYSLLCMELAKPQNTRDAIPAVAKAVGTNVFRVWGCFGSLCKSGKVHFITRNPGYSVAQI